MRSRHLRVGCAAIVWWSAPSARADHYEATIAIRPTAGVARVAELGTRDRDVVTSAGIAGGLSWGVRNWLDVGAELATSALGEATYDMATLPVDDNPMSGPLRRMTRFAQLRSVATLRLGIAWVPVVQLALGAGARQRSAALLRGTSAQGETVFVPDGQDAAVTLDLVTAVRVGLEHRLTHSWTVGLSVGASHMFGIGAPDLQLADVSFTIARVWYPLL